MPRRKNPRPLPRPFNSNFTGRSDLAIQSATRVADKLVLAFDQQVMVSGIPAVTLSPNAVGRTLDAVTLSGPTNAVLDFSGTFASATTISFANQDPALRSRTGGFVSAQKFPVT